MWISTVHQPEMSYLTTFGTLDILANERESTNGHEAYDSPLTNE